MYGIYEQVPREWIESILVTQPVPLEASSTIYSLRL